MTIFLSFGDSTYEQALLRIEKEARATAYFSKVTVKRPADLGKIFWRKHGRFIARNRTGYGYWLWKPWLILHTLMEAEANEILVYADAGCAINAEAQKRFDEYRSLTLESSLGVLAFRLQHEERRYTKGDAFEALNAWHLEDTPQVQGTVSLWRRCSASLALANVWLSRCEDYRLISDAPSLIPNHPDFIEHRHDQSLFSLLAKLSGATVLDDELNFTDWNEAIGSPFLARRLRGRRPRGAARRLQRSAEVGWQRLRSIL